jgi:hypothetical protein
LISTLKFEYEVELWHEMAIVGDGRVGVGVGVGVSTGICVGVGEGVAVGVGDGVGVGLGVGDGVGVGVGVGVGGGLWVTLNVVWAKPPVAPVTVTLYMPGRLREH